MDEHEIKKEKENPLQINFSDNLYLIKQVILTNLNNNLVYI